MDRRTVLGMAAGLPLAGAVSAQDWAVGERVPLWPGPPPGAGATAPVLKVERRGPAERSEIWLTGIAAPALHIIRPARANGVGLLAIPGGGYEFLAWSNEGVDLARVFAGMGYTVGVLAYRLPAEGWRDRADVPLQDAQRAMRLLRARAPGLRRYGVLGCSAGGHLAATLATGHGERVYRPVDVTDRGSARPDFAGLLYPVTTLALPDTHPGSRAHLLGADPSAAAVARRSPVGHVDKGTPPCFVLHSFDDTVVPVACGLRWIDACRAAGVAVEAHLLERGGHGFSVHLPTGNPGALWPGLFDRWVGQRA